MLGKVFCPERVVSISLLECRDVLIECRDVLIRVCTRLSRFFWTGQPLTYPAVQKSGAAAVAGDVDSEDRRQLDVRSIERAPQLLLDPGI
jgi:hypothetical protein